MHTNAEYEASSQAIIAFNEGTYSTLEEACTVLGANVEIAQAMTQVDSSTTPRLKPSRKTICDTCEENQNQTCMQCACPMSHILYADTAVCPLEKW
jgi:hypothetical protein